ncbi:hypothetical protein I33_2028 [Bacillus subtilis subsp. subtilis str. RO-NN-1]|nr:hypothetical protein I33_2028 [Bacillus subtilis subsp. subtilis str. RO-NN-1]AHA77851.1 Hypothetical Protein U712_09540 [Bacillus subtilis PY79]AKN13967.1 hypothetical protein ABU16_2891 [Bacillus subtilis]EHA30381.1 hypothetical protein BSSC8_24400 [Bacillus subtilis subsp. subtilis str. SC-8]EME06915.1 hypothetical protein BS732_2619 [Bacillus subtilis MB73/2]BAI85499.1 hypothetical protein BSNT_08396 [Bacillus subtilis subsp. natto BEST195]GAK81527.1 hypothetical protein BSMD_034430 [B
MCKSKRKAREWEEMITLLIGYSFFKASLQGMFLFVGK